MEKNNGNHGKPHDATSIFGNVNSQITQNGILVHIVISLRIYLLSDLRLWQLYSVAYHALKLLGEVIVHTGEGEEGHLAKVYLTSHII